jgi:acetyl-CoA C-acetyltransferase
MTERLRTDPGTIGLVTGLGGFATKHAVALYGTDPPAGGFRWERADPDAPTSRPVADGYQGRAAIEAWTVLFDRDGETEKGIAACITPDGRRSWATTTEPDQLLTMTAADLTGVEATLAEGRLRL